MTRTLPLLSALILVAGCDRADPAPAVPMSPVETTADLPTAEPQGVVVIVSVTGVEPGGEPVEAALQTEDQWGSEGAAYRARVTADVDAVALRFTGVTPGRYGVVAVQPTLPSRREQPKGGGTADAPEAMVPVPDEPNPLAALSSEGAGGWAASGAEGRSAPGWEAAGVAIGGGGATVPLTLQRR